MRMHKDLKPCLPHPKFKINSAIGVISISSFTCHSSKKDKFSSIKGLWNYKKHFVSWFGGKYSLNLNETKILTKGAL